MATSSDSVGFARVEEFGLNNEVVQSVAVKCRLLMSRENIIAALGGKGARRIALPEVHPLDAFDAGDGPHGDIPETLELLDFVWHGGANSWRPRSLAAFAALTKGTASFILVDVDGQLSAYEIENGELFRCDVGIAFQRRGSDEVSVKSMASLLKRLLSPSE